MALHVSVKGTKYQSAAAAAQRGIPAAHLCDKADGSAVVVVVGDEYETEVARWFCEPGSPPFSTGTCLFYSKVGSH